MKLRVIILIAVALILFVGVARAYEVTLTDDSIPLESGTLVSIYDKYDGRWYNYTTTNGTIQTNLTYGYYRVIINDFSIDEEMYLKEDALIDIHNFSSYDKDTGGGIFSSSDDDDDDGGSGISIWWIFIFFFVILPMLSRD